VQKKARIAAVIPAYKVSRQILELIKNIGPEITLIIVVDDACPENSGWLVKSETKDKRIVVITHPVNQGVGGAVMTGYTYALEQNIEIVVKLDGDGQMNPKLINKIVKPILDNEADYVKGNRFFNIEEVRAMPKIRVLGNLVLSFYSKLSSGYWNIFDPNNGFTAIQRDTLEILPFEKISKRYFFESDMLFRLNLARAKVVDMPMTAVYGDEKSNLSVRRTAIEFPIKHIRNLLKRITYSYFLRDFTLASLELLFGSLLCTIGLTIGFYNWIHSASLHRPTPTGTLILVAMATLSGIQLILSFTSYDMNSVPKDPRSKLSKTK
jgi:glycosyltransferase involved in cell wall biosynthesis